MTSRYVDSDESDEEDVTSNTSKATNNKVLPNINEVLSQALAEAADPGFGDEEPEVLPDPNHSTRDGRPAVPLSSEELAEIAAEAKIREEREAQLRQLMEEERRVAAMQFNYEAVLPADNMRERAKYIPLRLTYEERKSLRLVNAAINVSDYTNVVDAALQGRSRAKRHHQLLQQVVAFLSGIIASIDYNKGQEVLADRNFTPFESIIQDVLEIARRYKITNPEKMRSEYGKLVYLIQDAESTDIKPLLGISVHKPIKTVYAVLESMNCLQLLDDELIARATEVILPGKDKTRATIRLEIERKEVAVKKLLRKYATYISSDLISQCLYSIGDNNSFLSSNKLPVEECIHLLKRHFSPSSADPGYSLAINQGSVGSRLSHSHEMQFHYVHQSLALWSAILEDMFRLWYLSELDLLDSAQPYELRPTGQGLQRVQQSPRVYRAMHEILAITKAKLGSWVGSSVIHLGDNNVPNALIFIDKYTQVARILGPLVNTLSNIERAYGENESIGRYIDAYGGLNKARLDILHDFFRYGFDGSGGFNDFDAGSCIDGRLTSAWNWCSQLASKPYYPLFKITGFLSFDGEFDK